MNRHFIIGGAQRSATTYLMSLLQAHPDIKIAQPLRPEPKFFLKPKEYIGGYEEYRRLYFSHVQERKNLVLGEKSTSYIEYKEAAERIKKLLPDARLIFLLRHPVERAVSNVRFSRMHGFEDKPINDAILREIDAPEMVMTMNRAGISVSPQSYLARSSYIDHLKPWLEIFEPEQVKILITEHLITEKQMISEIYKFIGVEADFQPNLIHGNIINASDKPKGDELSPITYGRLMDYFSDKNKALSKLCNLDVSHWLS